MPIAVATALLAAATLAAPLANDFTCSVVGGGTLVDDRCYNRCSNLGCYRTWTLVDEAGERRFFGLFLPDLGADGETMPALISMSDGADTCRPNAQSQTASRYGYVRVCAGMGRSRGAGGWQFGNDAVMNTADPLPCSAEASPREIPYLTAILDTLSLEPAVDADSVWTEGFSLNSMFAAYSAFCFQTRIRGVWQGGSGLKITGATPMLPNREGDCRRSAWDELGSSCTTVDPCLECESFPAVPILQPGASRGLRDCIMIYEGDTGFIQTSQAMYDALAAKPAEEDWEAVLLEFPGGGHSSPLQSTDWIIGCLGIVVSCGVECESWFVGSCMDDAGGIALPLQKTRLAALPFAPLFHFAKPIFSSFSPWMRRESECSGVTRLYVAGAGRHRRCRVRLTGAAAFGWPADLLL